MKPDIEPSQLKCNISTLYLTGSHHIFLCRKDSTFLAPPYLLRPLVSQARGPSYSVSLQYCSLLGPLACLGAVDSVVLTRYFVAYNKDNLVSFFSEINMNSVL